MKHVWIRKNGARRLVVFFSGFACDADFLKEEDNTYLVLPTIARFNAKLIKDNTKQMDLFGGEEDV